MAPFVKHWKNLAWMFWKDPGGICFFFKLLSDLVGKKKCNKSKNPVLYWLSWVAPPHSGAWKRSGSRFTSFFTLLGLFRTHFHTTKTICPSFPLRGRALRMLLFPSVKCTQYHILEVISPKMWFLSPSFCLFQTFRNEHTPHACMHAYVLYLSLCWANTPLCLTCFLCHDDERHLLFSAETPLRPTLLTSCLHYSQVEW